MPCHNYVRLCGRRDLLLTMITNPKWTEIRQNLQQACDRPDLTVRLFKLKLQKLMEPLGNYKHGFPYYEGQLRFLFPLFPPKPFIVQR